MFKNQVIADMWLARYEAYSRLLAVGHFGGSDSEVYQHAAGIAAGFREVGETHCEHKTTRDTAGVGIMCLVCGAALTEEECGDGSS